MEPKPPTDQPGDSEIPGDSPPDDRDLTGANLDPPSIDAIPPPSPEFVPAGAEALFGAVPVEALAPTTPTDRVLADPIPVEALVGLDTAALLTRTGDLPYATEVQVPSLEEVVSEVASEVALEVTSVVTSEVTSEVTSVVTSEVAFDCFVGGG